MNWGGGSCAVTGTIYQEDEDGLIILSTTPSLLVSLPPLPLPAQELVYRNKEWVRTRLRFPSSSRTETPTYLISSLEYYSSSSKKLIVIILWYYNSNSPLLQIRIEKNKCQETKELGTITTGEHLVNRRERERDPTDRIMVTRRQNTGSERVVSLVVTVIVHILGISWALPWAEGIKSSK
jgi:hypothetical protein